MPQDIRTMKPQDGWPVSAVLGNAVGTTAIKTAPTGRALSHYLTGLAWTGGLTGDNIRLLRVNCPAFNGATDTLTVTDAAAIQMGTGDFSVNFWYKYDLTVGASSAVTALLFKEDGGTPMTGFNVVTQGTGLPQFNVGDGAAALGVLSSTNVQDGKWHMITGTCDRDSATGQKIYVDGVLNTSGDCTGHQLTVNSATNLVLTGIASRTFYVSQLEIHKGALLTQTQITALYNEGTGKCVTASSVATGLALALDEGTGATCYDEEATNNGTLANTTWADDGVPIDSHTLASLGPLHLASEVQVSAIGSYNVPVQQVVFPHAIKIGRAKPIRLLHTNGAPTILIFGYTDGG